MLEVVVLDPDVLDSVEVAIFVRIDALLQNLLLIRFLNGELKDFLDFSSMTKLRRHGGELILEDEERAAIEMKLFCPHLLEILLVEQVQQVLRDLTNLPRSLDHAPVVAEHFDQK